jgi:hypothetical protein
LPDFKSDHEEILVILENIKNIMEFHPSKLPISKIFDLKDEKDASDAAAEMVKLGFENKKDGYKVLMPKDSKLAKRIGYIVTTSVNHGLRDNNQERNIRYWTYHHDDEHYAIVLISANVLEKLGF